MAPPSKFPGITMPLSQSGPTQAELAATESLITLLHERGQFESEEEAQHREIVLGKLDAIFKEFVKRISLKRNLPESMANEAGGKIFTFGSYRLGVHGKASDIDTLCVAPKHVQREDFFTDMLDMLRERPEVTALASVTDAYVPVITFEFSGVDIDLLCARLALPTVPDDLELADDNLLKNLDEKCVRSLNGSRVTDDILRLVPNVDTFRTALRCIKLWAKQRSIYSNVMGFFGGVAWAIAVARICQLYPNAAAGLVVNKFFHIYTNWKWPQPVMLRQIEDGPLATRIWNPKLYPGDRGHLVPIITPAYPAMCSTHNMTPSTKLITVSEFRRGMGITDRIFAGTATWSDLMDPSDFFGEYKYYLQIIASSDTEERQLRWCGWVESRLRQLVMKLENAEEILIAHPYMKSFQKVTECETSEEAVQAAYGNYPVRPAEPATTSAAADAPAVTGEPNEGVEASDAPTEPHPEVAGEGEGSEGAEVLSERRTVYTTTFYIGLKIEKAPVRGTPRKVDIAWPVSEYVNLVKAWDNYEEDTMGVVVQHIKSDKLPAELKSTREQHRPARKRQRGYQKGVATIPDRAVKRVKTEEGGLNASPALEEGSQTASEAGATPVAISTSTSVDNLDDAMESTGDAVLPKTEERVESGGVSGEENAEKLDSKSAIEQEELTVAPKVKQNYSGLGSGFQSSSGFGGIKFKLSSQSAPVKGAV
ncbi:polynucleotide adenylyltransferase [Podochytrium sp. JEL0797]|nr:polynucleotide adenylyltransferase [Podochytrium sp. JEL0797]